MRFENKRIYTEPDSIEKALHEYCTALDAISEGIPLLGAEYFSSLKDKLSELEKLGLYKGKTSWHIPVAAMG